MRTFTCSIQEAGTPKPTLSLIMAETPERAVELARKEMMEAPRPLCMEVRENGKLLWVEAAPEAVASEQAGVAQTPIWARLFRSALLRSCWAFPLASAHILPADLFG